MGELLHWRTSVKDLAFSQTLYILGINHEIYTCHKCKSLKLNWLNQLEMNSILTFASYFLKKEKNI